MTEALSLPPLPRRTLVEGVDVGDIGQSDTEIDGPITYAALRGLAAQADAELVPVFRAVASQVPSDRHSMTIPVALEALTRIAPREALSIARRLRDSHEWQIVNAAGQAIVAHGQFEDLGWLRQKVRNPAYPYTDNVLARLLPLYERFPGTGPYPELAETFRRASTGKDRYQACKAIAATDPAFGTTLAVECLWDASPAVRSIAVEKVTLESAPAIQRLQEIVADPPEHPWNARTAESRLNDPRL